jgi:hypothetical protein
MGHEAMETIINFFSRYFHYQHETKARVKAQHDTDERSEDNFNWKWMKSCLVVEACEWRGGRGFNIARGLFVRGVVR